MSEKRFKLIKPLGTRLGLKDIFIKDIVEDKYYNEKEQVADLLNEQQATIQSLKEENKQLKLTLSEYGVDLKAFEIFKQKIGYYDKGENDV